MRLFLHLKSFYIYNLVLLLTFSLIVNPDNIFSLLNLSFYSIFHFLLIYLGVYHYKNILYPIYFLYGLGLDILLFSEIGPHLLIFMSMLFFLNIFLKFLYNFSTFKIYILLLILQLLMIFFEVLFSYLLFDFRPATENVFEIIIISIILSYPIFIIFSKIDELN